MFSKVYSFYSVRVITVLLGCTFVACFLFPWIWHGLHAFYDGRFSYPPGRTFRRVWQISVLCGLIGFYRWLGLQSPKQAGYDWNLNSLRNGLLGVVVVWGFLFGLSAAYVSGGLWVIHPRFQWDRVMDEVMEGWLRGTLVALLEEYIFRGLIFLSFCRRYGWWKGAVFSSLIFASLHFLQGRGLAEYEAPVTGFSGFVICGGLLKELVMRFTWFPDATGLFLIGLILCYAFHRTGSLWYSVGLHGAWVWFVSFRTKIWVDAHESALWFGERQIFDGILPMTAMLLIFPITIALVNARILATRERGTP